MNRTRRKAIKMARKHGRGIFAWSRNPFWQARAVDASPESTEALRASMRAIYNRCSDGCGLPDTVIVVGAIVNQVTESTAYDPDQAYLIQDGQITPFE